MKQKQFVEKPTILDKDTLMCEGDYMSKERIESKCDCIHSDTCKAICDLLDNKKPEIALRMLIQEFTPIIED